MYLLVLGARWTTATHIGVTGVESKLEIPERLVLFFSMELAATLFEFDGLLERGGASGSEST